MRPGPEGSSTASQRYKYTPEEIKRLCKLEKNVEVVILVVWVDDYLAAFNSRSLYDDLYKKMNAQYPIGHEGELSWMLGMKVTRDPETRGWIFSQERRILDTLKLFKLERTATYRTPMDNSALLDKTMCPDDPQEQKLIKRTWYESFRKLLGILLHMSQWGRRDIQYAVNFISSYQNNPGRAHFNSLKRTLGFLKGTATQGTLIAPRSGKPDELRQHVERNDKDANTETKEKKDFSKSPLQGFSDAS